MKRYMDKDELRERIRLNLDHLKNDPYYSIAEVFSPADYSWYGDKEGRALLAFVSHYKISGEKIPCMELMREQLSGHSWLQNCTNSPGGKNTVALLQGSGTTGFPPLKGTMAAQGRIR